jgi:transcriptional regulator with XRE-family HTH domain
VPNISSGPHIRAIRREKGLTLDALAAAAGLDKGHLSRVERGQKGASIATLVQIAAALKVKVAHLLGETTSDSAVSVVRAGARKRLHDPKKGGTGYESLLSGTHRSLESFIVYPAEKHQDPSLVQHHGEELVFVLSGEIDLQLVDRVVSLKTGDCAHFRGSLQHTLRRKGRRKAAALVVIARI